MIPIAFKPSIASATPPTRQAQFQALRPGTSDDIAFIKQAIESLSNHAEPTKRPSLRVLNGVYAFLEDKPDVFVVRTANKLPLMGQLDTIEDTNKLRNKILLAHGKALNSLKKTGEEYEHFNLFVLSKGKPAGKLPNILDKAIHELYNQPASVEHIPLDANHVLSYAADRVYPLQQQSSATTALPQKATADWQAWTDPDYAQVLRTVKRSRF
jgi:hypothetical protein